MTLTVARFLGISRHLAARFVFLMAIPVILGAVVLKSNDLVWTQDMFLGAGFTFIFSLIFLHGLLQFLKNYSLLPIVIYRIILGVILIVLS
jgi:undecaprenyl-diphosphatase